MDEFRRIVKFTRKTLEDREAPGPPDDDEAVLESLLKLLRVLTKNNIPFELRVSPATDRDPPYVELAIPLLAKYEISFLVKLSDPDSLEELLKV